MGLNPTKHENVLELSEMEMGCATRVHNLVQDLAPVETVFNKQDYATLVAHPSPFRKFPEAFSCLGEPRLLDTTIGRIVSLLPVAPDHAESELEASVERLFDKGVIEAADMLLWMWSPVLPKTAKGKENMSIVGWGSAIKRLLAGAVLNVEVEVAAIPTLPFVTASVSTTPEHSSHHFSGTNVAEVEVDSLVRSSILIMTTVTITTSMVDPASVAKEKLVKPSPFCDDSSSTGGTDPPRGWSFEVCSILSFFASIRGMEHDYLFTEFNVRAARQMSLSAEVRMCVEYNVKEKKRLKSVVERQGELLKVREGEIENLKAQLLLREAEAVEAICLRAEASNFKDVEKSLRDEMNAL
ncbi:hypothetical protein Tco_0291686 [Tanacetum coccineum]